MNINTTVSGIIHRGILLTAVVAATVCLCHAGRTEQPSKRLLNVLSSLKHTRDSRSETVTIFLERTASYKSRFLDHNPRKNLPYRLYLDLLNTRLSPGITAIPHPDGSPVTRIRIARRNSHTTRVVLDFRKKIYRSDYEIVQLDSPPRIAVKLLNSAVPAAAPHPQKSPRAPAASLPRQITQKPPAPAVNPPADEASSELCTIVIDPGHGGKDPGAIGYRGIREKDICLPIALELKRLFDSTIPCRTILTRTSDTFLSLEQRAEIANRNRADIFISVHANSHEDASLNGIETYYLNFSSDTTARKVAARENFTTPSKISDLEMILFDLMQSDKINTSSILAGYVHNALVDGLSRKNGSLRNLGVKHAPMRVLIDADMPGILLETAFISNAADCRLLKNKPYQKSIARAVVTGVRNFLDNRKTAFYRTPQ